MCGLTGFLSLRGRPLDPATLQAMTTALHHRGPDDSGAWLNGDRTVGLGNTRLAIIDLSADGHQPMSDGRRWITYNGEVYNFVALRDELTRRGVAFHSRTDTETILRLYAERGPTCLYSLRGMFALAIWDEAERTLFLARDRLGKKPLYYYQDTDWLIFGSEIKAILAHPAAKAAKRLNTAALPAYLTYGYVPTPDTLFDNIKVLPPGHYMMVKDGRVVIARYWDAPTADSGQPTADSGRRSAVSGQRSEAEWADALLAKLREAVRLRLISDVPLGAFLSGGLDSSAVVALMAEVGRVKTFAVGFSDEPSFDERPHARQVAEFLGCEHHEFVVHAQSVELVPLLVRHHDQPFGDSSAIPTYLVAKCARQHVTVALTGDGGDELFAGYDRFRAARLAEAYRRLPSAVRQVVGAVASALPQGTGYRNFARNAARFIHSAALPLAARYLRWVGILSPDLVGDLVSHESAPSVDSHFARYFRTSNGRDPLPTLLDVNLRTYLPDDLLVKADRATMAASLEARSPFLDHELVELAAQIPPGLKLKGGVSKYILKRALGGKLPPAIIQRQKHGFGVPVGRWFREGLKDYMQSTLLSERALNRGLLRPNAVRQLVATHLSGERDHGHALWALLTLEVWQRLYFDEVRD